MVGDSVTIEPVEVLDHYFDTIVRGRYDGTYDKFNRAGELIMSNYFSVRDGKIVSLAVIVSQPVRIRRNRGMTRRPLRGRPRPRSPATPGIGRASPPPAFLRPARRMTRFGAVITKLLRTYTIRILRQDKRLRDQRADVWRPSSGIYRYAGPMGLESAWIPAVGCQRRLLCPGRVDNCASPFDVDARRTSAGPPGRAGASPRTADHSPWIEVAEEWRRCGPERLQRLVDRPAAGLHPDVNP